MWPTPDGVDRENEIMNFCLDYDETYTKDPTLWHQFISMAKARGHQVFCISFRFEHQMDEPRRTVGRVIGEHNCFGTGHTAKRTFAEKLGIKIDVWIDDLPELIVDPINTRFYTPPGAPK